MAELITLTPTGVTPSVVNSRLLMRLLCGRISKALDRSRQSGGIRLPDGAILQS